MAVSPDRVSALLANLPAVMQEDRIGGAPDFLGRFLLGFEQLLLGLGDRAQPGLEEIIGGMARYFEPGAMLPDEQRAPLEFLPWLAGWVALTLREDWDELRQRDLIAQAASLYRQRGTRRGVEAFLTIYTRLGVEIDELGTPMQIGAHSSIGVDTLLGGGAPFYFSVRLLLPTPDPAQIKAQREVAAAIVDLQKPAHTFYTLTVDTPILQIGAHSKIGVDTLLG